MTEKDKLKDLKWERITSRDAKDEYFLRPTKDSVLKFWLERRKEKNNETQIFVIINGRVYEGRQEFPKEWETSSELENDSVHLQRFNNGECVSYRVVSPNWTAYLSRCPLQKSIEIAHVILRLSL